MDLGMQGAVFAGAFDSSPVGAGYVPVACPTGNCTFDPYWTLGMCSKVVDMTSQIQYKCRPFDWWNASSASPWSTGAPLCNYSVPVSGAVSTSETLNLFAKLTSLGWGQLNMTFFAGGTIAPNEPYLVSLQLLTWTKPRSGRAFSSSSEQLPDIAQGVGAVNGYIYPCMRRYSGAVSKGVFEERLITTAPMVVDMNSFSGFSDPAGAMSVHVGCLNHHELAIFAEKGYELEGEWSAVKGQDFESVARHIRSECLFSMLGEYASGAQQVFSQVFGFDSSSEFQGISAGGLPDYYRTYPTVQALNDYGNITLQSLSARFEDIARSMTAYMRRMPGDVPANGSQPAYGLAWESDTCVAVSWMWILLPGSLFSLTVLYLFGTLLILSRSRWETMWKSSSLPLLYHGLHDDAPTSLLSCDDLNGMELASKSQSVILHNSGDRWRFQSTGPQIVHTSVK